MSARTLANWRNTPIFAEALKTLDREMLGVFARREQARFFSPSALDMLSKVVEDREINVRARIQAAQAILSNRAQPVDQLMIDERLAAIEHTLADQNDPPTK